MAATGTPTPNIGLRRPQGTDPASVDDINYNSNLIDTKLGAVGNTSVQEQINSLNSNTTPFIQLGAISGSTVKDVIITVWDAIQITGKFISLTFTNAGTWSGIAWKSSDGLHGSMIAMRYNTDPFVLNVSNGTKTVKQCNTTTL